MRGTAQNPDVFFQGREAQNSFHLAVPGIVQTVMDELAARTGRQYGLVEYHGAPDADRVVVVMGSAAGALEETVDALVAAGEPVGMVRVRLFHPFPTAQLVAALPPTVRAIAVLDRTKEPGAVGEPMYLEVLAALTEAMDTDEPPFARAPRVIGGRYGLASKEVSPAMLKPVFDELAAEHPKRHFTIGIYDDVTKLSLPIDHEFTIERAPGEVQAVFFGLGSDGTVGANKSSVKIIGEHTDLWSQGYFVYDSKKSGSVTVSHLRFGPEPIRSTYLVDGADFVACHQFGLLEKMKVLDYAKPGATVLCNSPYPAATVWDHLPREVQQQIVDKHLDLWVIDALAVADEVGMGNRINTVMQPCFFQLAAVLPPEQAIAAIKASVEQAYGRRGRALVERNFAAIDLSLERLARVEVPALVTSTISMATTVPASAPDFVQRVTARLLAGEGDQLPVSAFPPDGTFPSGTAKYEKRAIATEIPIWDPDICIDCGKCAIVCPHGTIRMKVFSPETVTDAPADFLHKEFRSKDLPGHLLSIQVAPDDCTGCGVCVDICPAKSKTEVRHKAINMEPALEHRDRERSRWDYFLSIPPLDRNLLPHDNVKGSQVLEPLFEFSGACAGCGETPYLKLATQLFGDRMIVANATGCSSIYGGNLPTTPWTVNGDGRGPAWNNSLFEDNAEFGLGMRLALDAQERQARELLTRFAPHVGDELVRAILENPQEHDREIEEQRRLVARLRGLLTAVDDDAAADALASRSAGEQPRAPGSVDHRRGWMGLRHRLRWPRPRALVGTQREHPRARHRGVLEHRWAGVEGDATGRDRQVRRGRQEHRQEGPRCDRTRVRECLRRADLDGRERAADDQGTARSRRVAGAVARDRLLDVHRARHRHVEVDVAPEGRGAQRVLAALPLPPERRRRRPAVQARLARSEHPGARVRRDRSPLRHARAHAPPTRGRARDPGAGRRRRALALLRAARGDAPNGSARADDRHATGP